MDVIMIHRGDLDEAIRQAALMGAEMAIRKMPKNRPEQYNITDAGKVLGVTRQTVSKLISAGNIKLNSCGKIPASEIDRVISAKSCV